MTEVPGRSDWIPLFFVKQGLFCSQLLSHRPVRPVQEIVAFPYRQLSTPALRAPVFSKSFSESPICDLRGFQFEFRVVVTEPLGRLSSIPRSLTLEPIQDESLVGYLFRLSSYRRLRV